MLAPWRTFHVVTVGIAVAQGCTPQRSAQPEPLLSPNQAASVRPVYSSFLGGSGEDTVRDVAADAAGNLHITGGTASADFHVTDGAHDASFNGNHDVFVTKLDPGGGVIWSTYVGGPNYDRAYAIEVDPEGFVYVAGRAGAGFPVTPGAVQPVFAGGPNLPPYGEQDGFVFQLSPEGELRWATYFGTSDGNIIRDIDLDSAGNVYIASTRDAGAYPASIASAFAGRFQESPTGEDDIVVAKLTRDGSEVSWATYIGGSASDGTTPSIRVDAAGSAYLLAGYTRSADLPTSATAFDRSHNGGADLYVAKLSPDGTALVYGTYLGGSGQEFTETHGIAVSPTGRVYVAAVTTSSDFPVTAGAFQRRYGGSGRAGLGLRTNYPGDMVVSLLSEDGSRLLASTFLGGREGDGAEGIAVDGSGHVWVSGASASPDFPTTSDAMANSRTGGFDAVIARFSADLDRLLYASYVGGDNADLGRAAGVDAAGQVYLGGATESGNWPVRLAAQSTYRGRVDGIVVKLSASAQ